jgi:hypothetical protein
LTKLCNQRSYQFYADVNKRRRPDSIVQTIRQNRYHLCKGFGEVKVAEEKQNRYELNGDIVRFQVFAKESIDQNDINAIILCQVVGK